MKTLHNYILRQAVANLMLTVCVFGFILLLGNALREILALVVNHKASLGVVFQAILLLLPWIMAYVMPFGMLTAILLLFGRLSADNELTAVRASGISLVALVMPLLALSVVMCGLCAWFNMKVSPESRVAYMRLMVHIGLQQAENLLTEDRFIDEIPGIILYARKRTGDELEDVSLYKLENNQIVARTIAKRAHLSSNQQGTQVTIVFINGITESLRWREIDVREPGANFPLDSPNYLSTNFMAAMFTNGLPGRVIGKSRVPEWFPFSFGEEIYSTELPKSRSVGRAPRLSEMSFQQLIAEATKRKAQGITATPVLVQMHRQVAFSFASFCFTLVAIPLGIHAHRRETSIGFAISFLLALIYYSFMILSEALQTQENLSPQFIVWIPNILFQTLGITLLWRANRNG